MAKKKDSIYNSWEEIDKALRQLGELKIEKEKNEGELTLKINELKAFYADKNNKVINDIKTIEKEITRYCDENKDSFINKRNKKLNFGVISYRLTEKVVCSCIPNIIKSLKTLNLDFCLRIKEEIDKDKIKELDANTLAKVGVKVLKEDKLTIEPNVVKIAANTNT